VLLSARAGSAGRSSGYWSGRSPRSTTSAPAGPRWPRCDATPWTSSSSTVRWSRRSTATSRPPGPRRRSRRAAAREPDGRRGL